MLLREPLLWLRKPLTLAGFRRWFVDEPDYAFPDGSRMHTRLTAVLQREDGDWRIVHRHVSVGVPDEEVVTLQQRWATW